MIVETVKFELLELSAQIPTKTFLAEIQLHHDHIRYRVKFIADEYSEDTGLWNKDVGAYHDLVAKRSQIVAIEHLHTDLGRWKIRISINGLSEDLNIYFNNFAEASSLHGKLIKYITE